MKIQVLIVTILLGFWTGHAQESAFSTPCQVQPFDLSLCELGAGAVYGDGVVAGSTRPMTATAASVSDPYYSLYWRHQDGSLARWVMKGTSLATGSTMTPSQVDPQWRIAAVADFGPGGSPDGHPDLVWQHTSGALALWYMQADRLVDTANFVPGLVDPAWRIVGAGDFNRDGHPDLVWQSQAGEIAVWYMNGPTMTGANMLGQADSAWRVMGVADFNRDGYPDLVWEHRDGYLVLWYMRNETRIGTSALSPAQVDPAWKIVGVGDYNQDNDTDLLWQDQAGTLAVWYLSYHQMLEAKFLNPPSAGDVGWRVMGAVTANLPPVARVTSPVDGSTFSGPVSLTISADAQDADGTIQKVEFYDNGAVKLGEDTTSPYIFNWANVPAGLHKITAKVTDNYGLVASSAGVSLIVQSSQGNQPPTVAISNPMNNSLFDGPANITILVAASDFPDGSVTKVEFFNGTTKLGEDLTNPFSFDWNNIPAGSYQLTARATDNLGATSVSSPVFINVKAAPINESLTVYLSDPSGMWLTEPASVTLTANASNAKGTVQKVEFLNGTTLLGTDTTLPYSFNWANIPAGTYQLTARATDNVGATATSTPIALTIHPRNTAAITSPAEGASFNSPASVTVEVVSNGPDTVQKVVFNTTGALFPSYSVDTTSPYTFTWNDVPPGDYTVFVEVVYERSESIGLVRNFKVTEKAVNQYPAVSIVNPANGYSCPLGSSITLVANASDGDGSVAKVDFYDGATWLATDTTSPYSYLWLNFAAGNHVLTAKVTDNQGASTVSSPITVTVLPNKPPTASITTPTDGYIINQGSPLTIAANASDTDGSVIKVDFYDGTTWLGADTTAPFEFLWVNTTAGGHVLTVKATDNRGDTTTSKAVNIAVRENKPPVVSLINPVDGYNYSQGSTITVAASANDPDDVVTKVDFYDGTTWLGSDTTSPYEYVWSNITPGVHVLTAKAADSRGGSTSSSLATITVTSLPSQKSPILTGPSTSGSSITLAWSYNWNSQVASTGDGYQLEQSMTSSNGPFVRIYNSAQLAAPDHQSPKSYTISRAKGIYWYRVRAYEQSSFSAYSSVIQVIVP